MQDGRRRTTSVHELKGKVDVAIITVLESEFLAVLQRFERRQSIGGGKQIYEYAGVLAADGTKTRVTVVRSGEQGTTRAQSVTRDVIEDLDPSWLMLVGIAGGVPADEFSLGDVCLANRLHDFSVSAAIEGKGREYQQTGGPAHRSVQSLLSWLPAKEAIGEWNSETNLRMPKPSVDVPENSSSEVLYGPEDVRKRVIRSLEMHFPAGKPPRRPRFHVGPGATASVLLKDTELIEEWRTSARHLTHVEMEAGGVFEAAHGGGAHEYPLLCIRGISDIVGFKRDPEWTLFACHAAASLVHALLVHLPVDRREGGRTDFRIVNP